MTNNELRAWCEAEIEKCTKYGFSPEHEGKALALREVLTRIETNSRTGDTGDVELIADLRRMAKGQREGLHYEGSSVPEGFKFTAERAADRIESITPPEVGGELVERVARAISDTNWKDDADPGFLDKQFNDELLHPLFIKQARVAIAALSTPEVVDGTAGLVEALEGVLNIAECWEIIDGGKNINLAASEAVIRARVVLSQYRSKL